jgi:hypothetical protein
MPRKAKSKSTSEKARRRLGKLTEDKVPGGERFENTRTRQLAKEERLKRGKSKGMESVESRKKRDSKVAAAAGLTKKKKAGKKKK